MSDVRVRFAPSPTGYLHIGGVRTALYSWLWARQNGGAFVLRIEDTDQERSTEESVQVVLDSMRWLGLDWDEGPGVGGDHGPYVQSERMQLYADHAEALIRTGHAYRCYAQKEEIAAAREAHKASGSKAGFRFNSPWRDRIDPPADPNARHVVRFKSPAAGKTGWVDRVKGRIDVPNETQQDFILVRPDGMPLYNFGCVVDDLTMGITLVARGDDHIVNTAPQILIYEALNATVPDFAHMPMVLAPNGEKLSKRHAAVGVMEYRDMGYLPDSVLNYLARLGWSHGDQEIFTRAELIELFNWDKVGSNPGKYDAKKFAYVQAEHLRALSDSELAEKTVPFLKTLGVDIPPTDSKLMQAISFVKTRAQTLVEMAESVDYFFRDVEFVEKAKKTFLKPDAAPHLKNLAEVITSVTPFDNPTLEAKVKGWMEANELKMKQVAQPARVAMTGRTQSPGLFEVMEVLGEDETIKRLLTAADIASNTDA